MTTLLTAGLRRQWAVFIHVTPLAVRHCTNGILFLLFFCLLMSVFPDEGL